MSIETTDSRLSGQTVSRHERLGRAPADLASKLDLALKVANMSKGRLASEARVDKSLVGRWVRGLVVPSEHNLASVTEALSRKFPGFNLASWRLQPEAFAESIGAAIPLVRAPTPAGAPPPTELILRSYADSIGATADERRGCQGVYLGFRHGLRMGGRLICDVYVIWSEGETLMFKQFGVSFAHGGPACVVRGQIHLMGGDLRALNSLLFVIMFGVVGGRAMRMDGMLLTVAGNHRLNAPSATAVVMQRLADLPAGNSYPDQGALDRLLQRVKDAIASDNLKGLIALDILAAIAASAGDEANGVSAPILSVATERSLCRNELECDEKVARYSKTLREVFLAEDAPLLPMAPASGVPSVIF